jgi:hypothetical protein
MRFVCHDHGELTDERIEASGYSLGHDTTVGEPTERDLEGTTVEMWTDADGVLHVEADSSSEQYLSKFADWKDVLKRAAKRTGCETFMCPRSGCFNPIWLLEDDEPVPEP